MENKLDVLNKFEVLNVDTEENISGGNKKGSHTNKAEYAFGTLERLVTGGLEPNRW
ncbi:bacteriocin [Lactiplantibacillus sp. WILCCON 0030]|uniref:Bacteriocin n=1 Tax=Lactiplantibacillus brownii TaxID=3069269 RepID=A0ABU1A623_9LACO|nr:bacteriocin [Lactiplantibacillus brownii]MDQ7936150.1 bacteriocin [Lactiplantibacillus brownii]